MRSRHRVRSLVMVLAICGALAGCYGSDRTWPVGDTYTSTQMAPGLWRSLGSNPLSSNQCSWEKKDAYGNITGRSLKIDQFPMFDSGHRGQVWVVIRPGETEFTSSGCQPFSRVYPVIIPAWSVPLVNPGEPFGEGDYLNGAEVATDTLYYTVVPSDSQGCFFGTVANWSDPYHHLSSGKLFEQPGKPEFMKLSSTDAGFWSIGCGTWVVWPFA